MQIFDGANTVVSETRRVLGTESKNGVEREREREREKERFTKLARLRFMWETDDDEYRERIIRETAATAMVSRRGEGGRGEEEEEEEEEREGTNR